MIHGTGIFTSIRWFFYGKGITGKLNLPLKQLSWSRCNDWNEVYGGFLKWWYQTTIGFPTKNDHFGVFWGYHHLGKHPYHPKHTPPACFAHFALVVSGNLWNPPSFPWWDASIRPDSVFCRSRGESETSQKIFQGREGKRNDFRSGLSIVVSKGSLNRWEVGR